MLLDLGTNLTGFIGATIVCREKTRLFFAFDELLIDGDVDFKRMDCVNLVGWELEPGSTPWKPWSLTPCVTSS